MKINLRLFADLLAFAPVSRTAGANITLDLRPDSTITDLLQLLRIPPERARVIFVNGRVKDDPAFVLREGDDVGIFPPVGGG